MKKYTADFNEVKSLGGDGITTPSARTADQTEIVARHLVLLGSKEEANRQRRLTPDRKGKPPRRRPLLPNLAKPLLSKKSKTCWGCQRKTSPSSGSALGAMIV